MAAQERPIPKLLIVDDVELNRALLGEMFQSEYHIYEAEDGLVALDILEREHEGMAAVLLDIVMPELDGFGVLQEMIVKGWIGHIPVVMITAETSDSVMQRGYEMGAADIISKPFNPNIVRQRIRNVVEQYTYRHKLETLVEEQTDELRRQAQELRENSIQLIDILSTLIEFKNTESVQHIHNIRIITKLLLTELAHKHREYGLSEAIIEASSEAAALHDIGKIAIPDHILNKPGRLTPEEFEIVKTHSLRGCEILEKLSAVRGLVYYDYCYEICRHHHERWDGGGYPDGLKGDEIPIWAQAVSLADVYDALVSKRVYKDAYASYKAVQMILNGECGAFNPVLIECFLRALPEIEDYAAFHANELKQVGSVAQEASSLPLAGRAGKREPDVSARTLRLLELERQKYQILSELSEEILLDYSIQEDKLTLSEKFQQLTGKDPVIRHTRLFLHDEEVVSREDRRMLAERLRQITPDNPACKLQMRLNLDGRGKQWYGVYLYPIWDTGPEPVCVGYIGKLINIESQKQEKLRLQRAAETDSLTGIWNQKAVAERVTAQLEGGSIQRAALCFLDVDNFKAANDTHGHAFGDDILRRVAVVLKTSVRKTDLVGRIGGDEFLMFLQDMGNEHLGRKINQIRSRLSEETGGCGISLSVGVAFYPQDGLSYQLLLERADQALYYAKGQGKDRCWFYDERCAAPAYRSLLSGVDEPLPAR